MSHAFVTVVVPFFGGREDRVNDYLDRLGNVAGCGATAKPPRTESLSDEELQGLGRFVHFMSMVVIPEDGGRFAHLVIEACADGQPRGALERLVKTIPGTLRTAIQETGNDAPQTDTELGAYLEARRVEVRSGFFTRTPGLVFSGTPGMTVGRIQDEARLAGRIRELLDASQVAGSARSKLEYVRSEIFRDAGLKWAFVSEPVPLLASAQPRLDLLKSLFVAAWREFLWPLVFPPVLVGFLSWYKYDSAVDKALWHLVAALGAELLLVGAAFAIGYWMLRRQEEDDVPIDVEPSPRHVRRIISRENQPGVAQNHLGGVSVLKPGRVRRVSLRIALWLIAELARGRSRPGFLDQIGTIHFARWLLLPGTDRLVFLSNYDGSWPSYLEDFIARLRQGLTSVWSNTRNFPKTANLIAGGAGDGARFKRWARRQQQPTRFWYSAYPQLTNSRIRTNAAIRHGFASASNESEAAKWLALFEYAQPETVETEEIPTLVFGGLSKLRFAHCLLVQFGEPADARQWLRKIEPDICYGNRRGNPALALVAAFTCSGMSKLGLDSNALETFPTAFQHGMSAPGRARALGDHDTSKWEWGGTRRGTEVDALLLLYADTAGRLQTQISERTGELKEFKHLVIENVRLSEVPEKAQDYREPFGFRDGISQPVMRGSKDWSSPENEIHVVEPGELVLGYHDNLRKLGPSPFSMGRDIGRNGTFLVVRQLEQNKALFRQYIADTARALEYDSRVAHVERDTLEHWIEARMVGRWKDGSSLIRYPEPPEKRKGYVSREVGRSGVGSSVLRQPESAEKREDSGPVGPDKDFRPDNDFRFGREDPDGLRCPLGAHIRRANPRDSFEPDSPVQLAISNRHRILRVGRNYEGEKGDSQGLLFMCINADIERQFEFLQQTWLLGSNFHGLDSEIDPIVGFRGKGDSMTVRTPRGPVRLEDLKEFVKMLGGGYFFIPGRSTIRILAS